MKTYVTWMMPIPVNTDFSIFKPPPASFVYLYLPRNIVSHQDSIVCVCATTMSCDKEAATQRVQEAFPQASDVDASPWNKETWDWIQKLIGDGSVSVVPPHQLTDESKVEEFWPTCWQPGITPNPAAQ